MNCNIVENIDNIILDSSNWTSCVKHNYKNNQNKINNYIKKFNTINFCDEINQLTLTNRIGSESVFGQVFKYAPPQDQDLLFAIKLIPILVNDSSIVNKEIETATTLSKTNLPYYPKVYVYGYCNNTIIREKNKEDIKTTAVFMVTELLSFDLYQLLYDEKLSKNITENLLINIITSIINIIDDLNNTQRIIHNDLHVGNIMFRCISPNSIEPVFIDFGLSVKNDQSIFKFNDIKTFFKSLLNNSYELSFLSKFPCIIKSIEYTLDILSLNEFNTLEEYKQFFIISFCMNKIPTNLISIDNFNKNIELYKTLRTGNIKTLQNNLLKRMGDWVETEFDPDSFDEFEDFDLIDE
jgi:hypothetical protein